MVESRLMKVLLRGGALLTLAFIYVPLLVIALYAFNQNVTQAWPIENFSTKWFSVAFENEDARDALVLSIFAALGATAIALALGTLASIAVSRYRFFGQQVITFAVILPIALPGIITGLALQATILDVLGPLGVSFGLATIIVGHATFCVVVVYNNVIARMRRTVGSLDEASADLGADTWQTFRYVMFPQLKTALLAGALARVRALVRRGRRDDLHGRRAADAADLDLRDARPPGPAADRERRRALRHPRLDHPCLLRCATGRRERAHLGATGARGRGCRRRCRALGTDAQRG